MYYAFNRRLNNLKLDFDQVLELVKQLPEKEQKRLADFIENKKPEPKKLTRKEQSFLADLDGAVGFVNN